MTSEIQEDSEMMTSFSNPNYLPNVADALNSNLPDYYHDNHIYEDVIDSTDGDTNSTSKTNAASKRRKKYGQIDLNSMGVSDRPDLSSPESMYSLPAEESGCTSPVERTGAIVEVEHTEEGEPCDDGDDGTYAQVQSKGFLGYYASLELSAKAQLMENDSDSEGEAPQVPPKGGQEAVPLLALEKHKQRLASRAFDDKMKDINSPDSNDSGIQADVHHIQAPGSEEIYAVVNKPKKTDKTDQKSPEAVREKAGPEEDEEGPHETEPSLPSGWECHTDEDGPYYWHIKSGTIQREPPSATDGKDSCRPNSMISECSRSSVSSIGDLTSTSSSTETHSESHGQDLSSHSDEKAPDCPEAAQESEEKPIRFAVRSLGWVRIEEEDLTPERSSKAVNRCIVDLSLGRNDINDVVGRWGDGKDLYMDLDNQNLTLIDPQDMSVLNVQSIQSIRVWGVGRDNGRDFAYVARDRTTRKHMCHVFRCDTPARQIANTLRDICKRIMLERSLAATSSRVGRMAISRPTDLPNLEKATEAGEQLTFQNLYKNTSFPTPMEEPKKLIRCHYLGTANVTRPTGVEILNSASEKVYAQVPPEKWVFVNVAVAPSTITITEYGNSDNVLAECRVRFLSFMGIAMRNVKLCSFIMHSAQDSFIAHVFHCEPSAGALCKTIEAACKLRYQKCLDAHQRKAAAEGRSLQQELPQTGLPATTGNNKVPTRQLASAADAASVAVLSLEYSGKSKSVSYLLVPCRHSSPGHQQSIPAQLKAGVQNVFGMLKKTAKGLNNDSNQENQAAS